MHRLVRALSVASIVFCGAIFGFFYAWVCSTMWGLDRADPRIAIEAMQAMNASLRNAVFFPAFFLTPVVLLAAAAAARLGGEGAAAFWFLAAAGIYLVFGLAPTMVVNVPMNEALAGTPVPASRESAQVVWISYSERWQFWNQLRTVAAGIALALAGIGATRLRLPRPTSALPAGGNGKRQRRNVPPGL
ncbi:putative membrane protein [Chelatococcus caeni]|uniref:Putative membrane protein n=1 Tax=Chelatococcus caeni TaxID=1348468 RepID=A0A840BPC5_9HYPH|nr:anthrone oxygenase family protein [Chelatococcus caeni]MBB4015165.1 putative membrane protein [Chelatococcus caeni]